MGVRRVGLVAVVVLGLLASPGSPVHAARRTHALFFGDSLFAGSGARPYQPVQVQTANRALGWQGALDTFGGTGYTTGGLHGRPYLQRLQRDGFLRTSYDVIVLEGGTNDALHGSLPELNDAALAVVDYVQHRQPKAQIVLVGGFAPSGASTERYVDADRVLAAVAADRGLVYISQLKYGPAARRGFYSRDDLHPTTIGYRQMGHDLATALAAAAG
ncbi:MAG: arylesterase [Frankiales bacterium]|nr:arylesterase [Frankiales bacterium]